MNQKTSFIAVTVILVLAFIMAVAIYNNFQGASGGRNQSVVERQGAPVEGPHEARVTIVEFFDPACGTCASFYPLVKQLMEQYPGKVKVMMRYAPLHTGSDEVVKMLEAAHLQGKFFPALELLFKNQQRWVVNHVSQPTRARGILNGMALDHDKLAADLDSPEVNGAVAQDISDGKTLDVKATPDFYVNGKPLTSFGFQQLSQLVKDAVEDAY